MAIANLPPQLTPFVGRDGELVEIMRLLADPACRLLTLTGPGGIGKTRLALEVARILSDNVPVGAQGLAPLRTIPNTVHFIPLQPLTSPDFMASAIADALGFHFYQGSDPERQLLDFLRDKFALLILDNLEHLLDGVNLLSEILACAPDVRILATSRERLNLREEWIFDVQGLPVPPDEAETDIEAYGAVQLFVQNARRAQASFTLTDGHKPAVTRICRLVGGMPLGIELAAAWVRALPYEAIAGEIERSLDILETPARNVEPRHRNMRAAFEPTWNRLSEEEQRVYRQLAVFRGGFTREAAEAIVGASLRILTTLVDKSLLRIDADGRYQLHELLRQYAEEQRDTGESRRVYDAHAAYYADFLHQREAALHSARQRQVVQELEDELDNVRAALRWAVQQADIPAIQKAAYAYYDFCDMRGRYQEAVDAIEQAIVGVESIAVSEERDFTLAILHIALSGILIRFGRFEEAGAAIGKSITLYDELGRSPPPGFGREPLANMSLLAVTTGDYEEAVSLGQQALKRIEAADQPDLMFAHYVLANAAYKLGQYEAAVDHARQAHQLSESLGDGYFSAYVLIVMGNIAQALEDYEKAWEYYQTSYTLKREFNEQVGMAFALNCMARIAWLRQDYQEAQRLYQQAHDLYRDVNDPGGLATSIFGLGDTAQMQGESPSGYFYQALKIASDIRWTPLILEILTGVGDLLLQTGATERAVELVALVTHHTAAEPPARRRAERLLERARTSLSTAAFDSASARGSVADVDTVVRAVYDQLPPAVSAPRTGETLVEPLSERELEIMRLLAQGLTNQQIAEQLSLVVGTVKAHNHHIFGKLAVANRVQAIARAQEFGLI